MLFRCIFSVKFKKYKKNTFLLRRVPRDERLTHSKKQFSTFYAMKYIFPIYSSIVRYI